MNRIFVLTTLLSVCALSFSAVVGNNRYGPQHGGNSLGYRGAPRYPAGPQGHRSAPPQHQAYGARTGGYRAHQPAPVHAPAHPRAPAPYAGGRHHSLPSPSSNHYGGPAPYGAGPVHYGGVGSSSYGGIPAPRAPASPHYSAPKRSVYQQPQQSSYSAHNPGYGGHAQPQTYSQSHSSSQSTAQTHGREMKYTINDPKNKGATHVTETHVVHNRQMHGAEAEAAMKKLMGSMGPSSDGGFGDLVKGMGLNFY